MKGRVYHIGRSNNSNELFIFSESVSTSHAQVIIDENNDLIIIDLESKNGVIVNGDKIFSPVKLIPGDTITLGEFKCTQKDLLHSIKVFDFKNNQPELQSVVLKSSILQHKKLSEKRKFKIGFSVPDNFWIWFLLVVAIVLLIFGIYSLSSQSELKEKYNNKSSKTEQIEEVDSNIENPTKEKNKSQSRKKQRTDVTYDFSCLITENDGGSNENLILFGDLTRDVQNSMLNEIDVTVSEEQEYGEEYIKELKKTKKFITSGSDLSSIKSIMRNLVSRLAKPRGFKYKIYLVEDSEINAMTVGGHIVIYTGMIDFCKNNSEIASVISHEIAHNELGHLTLNIKKQKAAQDFGILGEIALALENIATAGFNQKQETEADLFGTDLMYPTSYKSCSAIILWKRMGKNDRDFNVIDNFIRSHPYSKNRAHCIDNHLISNYKVHCE